MRGMPIWRIVCGVSLGLMVATGHASAQAAEQAPAAKSEPAQAAAPEDGAALYQNYCAVCHGKEAKGDGPAVSALKKAPPDLTMLASRSGGKFDFNGVQKMIVGQERMMAAHGNVEMPIWGPVFKSISSDEAAAKERATNLVKYLESIQVK